MSDIPEDELNSTRAALEPTLRVAADILPLIAKARQPRFPVEKAKEWQGACERLASAWSDRFGPGLADVRPAVFALCAVAVELCDADCLRLAEALASATDLLEDTNRRNEPRLVAALSAACECLSEDNGLEHPMFVERARHLAIRLEQSLTPTGSSIRTPTLDRIFVLEAGERLAIMRDALDLLPPDAYAIKAAAEEVADLARPLELHEVIDRAIILTARLTPYAGEIIDLDDARTRKDVVARIGRLEAAIGDIELPDDDKPAPIVF